MKYLSLLFLSLALALMVSCSSNKIDLNQEIQTKGCSLIGTVDVNKCGYFIQLENGMKVQPKTGFSEEYQREGLEVKVGYASPYARSASHASGGSCGTNTSGEDVNEITENTCGVMEVDLICLQSSGK